MGASASKSVDEDKEKRIAQLAIELGVSVPQKNASSPEEKNERINILASELGVDLDSASVNALPTKVGAVGPDNPYMIGESPSLGSAAKHVGKGFVKGWLDMADIPNMVTRVGRWAVGEEPNEYIGSIHNRIKTPEGAKNEVFPQLTQLPLVKEYYDNLTSREFPRGQHHGLDAARTFVDWAGAGPVNALKKASLKFAKPDVLMGSLAAIGELVGGEVGELVGGGMGLLAALRSGKPSKLSTADKEALEFILENTEDVGEVAVKIERALREGEIGTLADLIKDRQVFSIQEGLRTDQRYVDKVDDLQLKRDEQILEDVQNQFGNIDSSSAIDAAKADVAAEKLQIDIATKEGQVSAANKVEAERAALEAKRAELDGVVPPSSAPATARAEGAAQDAQSAQAELIRAEQARQAAEASLDPLRRQNFEGGAPPSRREEIFKDADMSDPEDMQRALERYWYGDAFSEVKGRKEPFILDDALRNDLENIVTTPEGRIALDNYLLDVAEKTRRARDIPIPDMMAEGFNIDKYISDIFSGKISGRELMPLRNHFAKKARSATDADVKNINNNIKHRLDAMMYDQLDEAGKIAYKEQMDVYPAYLANAELMDTNKSVLAYGEYLPADQVAAGKKYGRPNLESNRAANAQLEQSKQGLDKAVAASKAADTKLTRAEAAQRQAVTREESVMRNTLAAKERLDSRISAKTASIPKAERVAAIEGGKATRKLNQTLKAQYVANPQGTIKKWLTDPAGAEQLKSIYGQMADLGEKEAFRAAIGEAIVESLNSSKVVSGGVRQAQVLPRATGDFQKMVTNLLEGGILDADEVADVSRAIERSITRSLAAEAKAGNKVRMNDSELAKFSSSVGAVLALNASPLAGEGSHALVMASTYKRVFAHLYRMVASRKKVVLKLQEITADPQKFSDLLTTAKSEDEAMRLWLTELVGTGQASAILSEEGE